MTISETFYSKQQKLRGGTRGPVVYDEFSEPFRIQMVQITHEQLCSPEDFSRILYPFYGPRVAYKQISKILRREFGTFNLSGKEYPDINYCQELTDFLLYEQDTEKFVTAVEAVCRIIETEVSKPNFRRGGFVSAPPHPPSPQEAIREINERFNQHNLGYQFVDGGIIRIDSQLIHSQVTLPALRLLAAPGYSGPQEEFFLALEYYRKRDNKAALNECLKAFESLMKAISQKRGWEISDRATAKDLIQVCLSNGLVPPFWDSSFNSLRSLLESSVPTGRNRLSGHGQGAEPVPVPDSVTAYMLHMTASAIVFLATAEAELP